MGRLSLILSSGLGIGYIPVASGTFGTLWGVLLFFLAREVTPGFFLVATLAFIALAIVLAHFAERHLGTHDSSLIVVDEVAGFLVTVVGFHWNIPTVALAFVLFRLFDILKPFPARWIDRSKMGGFSVVLDDVVAGIYANLTLRVFLFVLERWTG